MSEHYIRNGKVHKTIPAGGTKGILLHVGDKVVFRVYDEDSDFVDYDLAHNDLAVQIEPGYEAAFYEGIDGKRILDHSPQTLGLKKPEKE